MAFSIGSTEICNVPLSSFADEVEGLLCLGCRKQGTNADETVVLFRQVDTPPSGSSISPDLVARIKVKMHKGLGLCHAPVLWTYNQKHQ